MKKIISGLIIVVVVAVLVLYFLPKAETPLGAKQFTSYAELSEYIKNRSQSSSYYSQLGSAEAVSAVSSPQMSDSASKGGAAADYSTTNIQVEGVDEPDIVKNDGKYIYTVSQDRVMILDAYPAENMELKSEIDVNGSIQDIFINGDKLTVFSSGWGYYYNYGGDKTNIFVYDVSDHESPQLVRNISIDGYYFDARMIGDYVYVISNQYVNILDSGPVLPTMQIDGQTKTIAAEEISYFDVYDESFYYTFVTAINTQDDSQEPNNKVFLLGYNENMFVSQDSIYLVYTKYMSYDVMQEMMIEKAILPNVPTMLAVQINEIRSNTTMQQYEKWNEIGEVVNEYAQSLGPEDGAEFMKELETKAQDAMVEIQKENEKTTINKIGISDGDIDYKTSGEIPGRVLNQFSMDEYNGDFRIATTTGEGWGNTSLNHLFVLDSSLDIIGKIENIERGEQIYSVRFMGDRAYMVTFRRTDPLFVIDLSDPRSPQILGELKIPGVSDYLHPYDENHLIGLGQQADESGRMTGQVKISLFDVSDVSNPSEMSTYLIGEEGDWAYSDALYDHKAFLFSEPKNLLVIPVSMNNWHTSKYSQGAYVFDISLNGIEFRGEVTHLSEESYEDRYYYDYLSSVKRSLYMDDTLYTISDSIVKANSLIDLSEIKEIKFNVTENRPIPIYYAEGNIIK